MRKFIEIINESLSGQDDLARVLTALIEYIRDNSHRDDWWDIARQMRALGYVEPVRQTKYFRAIFHEPTEADRSTHATIGDLFAELQREARFDLARHQSFTVSFDQAIDFIHSTYNIVWYRPEWPTQSPDKLLGEHGKHSVAVVYEVEASPNQIIWSMAGLKAFLPNLPRTPEWEVLHDIITDIWTGYGHTDEVLIDTSKDVSIVGMTLYETDEHLI